MSYEVDSIHKILCAELENYIKAQYFGKSPLLLDALSERLNRDGVICRVPYVESLTAYKTAPDGFNSLDVSAWLKKFFKRLGEAGPGVYLSPFVHQIQALSAATAGRDLFVSTGTGSGKTECFMWPILAKLATEAHDLPAMWAQRGVRVMIMYPLNALVADQLSRLRRSIGTGDQRFVEIFRDVCGRDVRRPQFGMYTGRTPYPGSKSDKTQDRQLAATLREVFEVSDKDFLNRLIAEGKVPTKAHIDQFLAALEEGRHITDAEDAELITRFEMQSNCPDILITNYSMLEYMLMRRLESRIWDNTRAWLGSNPSNKLLFVIDEAHMYKGSSGGEVALLLRRLMYKLGIGRDRVQFILTTASMPDDRDAVDKFFKDLTASDFAPAPLKGESEKLSADAPVRMHMMFRGIGGVYELYNDRHCGTLFFKGYVFEDDLRARKKTYLRRKSGQILDKRLKEIHLFIPPEDYEPAQELLKGKHKPASCYLDVRSGFLYFDGSFEGRDGFRKLYFGLYHVKGRPDVLSFYRCPHCLHRFVHTQLTSFGTRGNQSFFNLIKTQFQQQPAVPEKMNAPAHIPNEGRKVLIFSDSRQRAATLARDMSKISDETAARQLFALAVERMERDGDELSLSDLYVYFCLARARADEGDYPSAVLRRI